MSTKEDVRGKQDSLCLAHRCELCSLNLGHQAWQQVPLPTTLPLLTSKEHVDTRLPFLKTLTYKKYSDDVEGVNKLFANGFQIV